MFKYDMRNVDKRKAEIVAMLRRGEADGLMTGADCIIVADLVISGVEKVMETLSAHFNASERVLTGAVSYDALIVTTLSEVATVSHGMLQQIGAASLEGILNSLPPEKRDAFMAAAVSGDAASVIAGMLREMIR
jgi:hypothetical protein